MFEKAGLSPFRLDIEYHGTTSGSHSALEKREEFRAWAGHFYAGQSVSVSRTIVLAGLWPEESYVLAHEQQKYASLLAAVGRG